MKYAEQISAFEQKRASLVAANDAIMEKATEAGATLDAEQKETFDGNAADVKEIDEHLDRLRTMEKAAALSAKPAQGYSADEGSRSRGGEPIVVKGQPKLAPGIELARLVKCIGMSRGVMGDAVRIAENRYGQESNAVGTLKRLFDRGGRLEFGGGVEKANVSAGSTASGSWAEDLVLDEGGAFADFAEYLRPETILGRFGSGNIPSLRRVPFRTALGSQTGGGAGYWVGEGQAKPLTSFDFAKTTLEPLKAANIAVLTEEIIRDNSAAAEQLVRDALRDALVETIDTAFIDPSNSGSAGVKPAAITNGATGDVTVAASGTGDADDVRLDIRSVLQLYINANNKPRSAVMIMRSGDALALGMMVNALGQAEFSGIGMDGGVLMSIPVLTSEYVPAGYVVVVNTSDIYFADEGGFMIDLSREASLLMTTDANSNMNSTTPTGASLVSMFQTNSVAFRCERTLNWARRRDSAVALISGVAWGGAVNT